MFYDRNPSGDVTVIRFYKTGEFLGQYYGADGDLFEFHQPENPDAIDQLLDGRFSFVNAALEYEDDDEEFPLVIHASQFEDANNDKLASAHLFLPFMSENLLPYGTIVVNE